MRVHPLSDGCLDGVGSRCHLTDGEVLKGILQGPGAFTSGPADVGGVERVEGNIAVLVVDVGLASLV
jgi:hypothetical protein